ncbi:sugar-binding transcriptional regulator [Sagittula sp. NFXS13]|uniref:DNA-binding transcriptional regulator LsrR (DeoR family) n=1 Tax=Sagittula marina TaxID=943940 RepID=A0A7W6DXQ2_9RHOB|nr:sugar-binding transcriptional regulator [Sagittula marina]MBB3987164.1 DNA-binding transcriptional regulator LsrR (DeoR family) [Sagittula marina]
MTEDEKSLAIRAAWLHYIGGLTQAKVAKRLGLPSVKTHRLIARAVADGNVKVSIEGDIVECVALEAALYERYDLKLCEVAPDVGEEGLPLRTLALAGAAYLRRQFETAEHTIIGLGHGRTLAEATRALPRMDATGLHFVSLLGGLTRNFAANPHDVMHRISEKTGARAYVMPVPFFANTPQDREVLLNQRGVDEVFRMAQSATLKVVGIGTVDADAQLVTSRMIEPSEIEQIARAGAQGEMLGDFFDADGHVVETTLSARTLAVGYDPAREEDIVAIAGGPEKVAAIRSVLRSGRVAGLITDELTARALLD